MAVSKRSLRSWRLWRWWGGSPGASKSRARRSALSVERLDVRQLMAGDLDFDPTMPPPDAGTPPAESGMTAGDPTSGTGTTSEPPADPGLPPGGDPGMGDPGMGGGAGDPGTGGGGTGGGDITNYSPPEITSFNYEWTGTTITVYGQVIDNGSVNGLFVDFGGLLSGVITQTDEDGYFSVSVEITSSFGTITAVVTDTDGWTSDVASLYVL